MVEEIIEEPPSEEFRFIIPGYSFAEISRVMKETDTPVRIILGDGQIFFETESMLIFSRLLEGTYPNYEQVIPRSNDVEVIVDREKLQSALRRALLLAQEKDAPRLIKMAIGKEMLKLSTNTPDLGDAEEDVAVLLKRGEPVEVAFNGKYLMDVLNVITSKDVTFLLTNESSPGLIKPSDRDNVQYVVMPIRLKEREEEAGKQGVVSGKQ